MKVKGTAQVEKALSVHADVIGAPIDGNYKIASYTTVAADREWANHVQSTTNVPATFRGYRSRGAGAPIQVNSGQTIAAFNGSAYTGSTYSGMGGMEIYSTTTVNGNQNDGSAIRWRIKVPGTLSGDGQVMMILQDTGKLTAYAYTAANAVAPADLTRIAYFDGSGNLEHGDITALAGTAVPEDRIPYGNAAGDGIEHSDELTFDNSTGQPELTVAGNRPAIQAINGSTAQYSRASLVLQNTEDADNDRRELRLQKESSGAATGESNLLLRRTAPGEWMNYLIIDGATNDICFNQGRSSTFYEFGDVCVENGKFHIKDGFQFEDASASEGRILTSLGSAGNAVWADPVQRVRHMVQGRAYFYTDDRWISVFDDNYGAGYYQWNENAGTGADPNVEWEHMGIMVSAGETLKRLVMNMRGTNNNVTDVEVYVVYRTPTTSGALEGVGVDADGEMTNTVILREFFRNPGDPGIWGPAHGGNMNDTHRRKVDLDFVCPEDGWIGVYLKPNNTSFTSTYYGQCSFTFDLEL